MSGATITMPYLLDTSAISNAVRFPDGSVARQIELNESSIITSVIVESELRFDLAQKAGSRIAQRVNTFLNNIEIVPFDSAAATHYGDVRAYLEALGLKIESMDTLIAAHTRSLNACLVTHNVSHFERVPDLRWENWQGDR